MFGYLPPLEDYPESFIEFAEKELEVFNEDRHKCCYFYDEALRVKFFDSHKNEMSMTIDLNSKEFCHKREKSFTRNDLFAKAMGLKNKPKTLVDLNAGLLGDSFHALCLGLDVVSIEREKYLFPVIENAIERARIIEPEFFAGIQAVHSEAIKYLEPLEAKKVDVFYMDPMFPGKKEKSALSSKEMQFLQVFVEESEEEAKEVLNRAIEKASQRVVVKRPLKAEALLPQVSHSYKGKSIRYDVYLPILT